MELSIFSEEGEILPNIVADRFLDALIGLESDIRVSDQRRPDPARLGPGGNFK